MDTEYAKYKAGYGKIGNQVQNHKHGSDGWRTDENAEE